MHRTTSCLACVVVVVITALAIATVAATARGIYGDNAGRVPRNWERVRDFDAKFDKATATYNVVIGLKRSNPDKLDALFHEVSDPRSPRYGEHLTNEQMRQLVSPGPRVVGSVVAWLRSAGMREIDVARHEDYVSCVGTAALIEKMLGVSFVAFRDKITSHVVHRAVGAYQLPAELASAIEVIGGISGFPIMKPKRNKNKNNIDVGLGSPQTNVTPSLLYKVYNMTSFPATPSNKSNIQSFFQTQGEYVDPDDLKAFCKRYLPDIPADKCKIEKFLGYNNNTDPTLESSMDSQYLFATGHGTETWVYSYKSMDFCGSLMQWAKDVFSEASGDFPHVISISYGSQQVPNYCLGPDVNRLSEDVKKMGTMGISVITGSGDVGSGETCDGNYNYGLLSPSFFASIPYITAVGATTFKHGNSGEEVAVQKTFSSGGGFSYDYVAPDYQKSFIDTFFQNQPNQPPTLSYNRSGRATPDVSTLGEGFFVIQGGETVEGLGTSISTPTFAGMVTLLNNVRLAGSGKHLGFINYLLYQNPDAFNDITEGNNDFADDGCGWYTTKGWDPVTGLGTPNFGKLVEVVKKLNARGQQRDKKEKSPPNVPNKTEFTKAGFTTVWEATLPNFVHKQSDTRNNVANFVPKHKIFVASDENSTIYGINTTNGVIAWSRSAKDCASFDITAFAVGSDVLALASTSCSSMRGFDIQTGALMWTSTIESPLVGFGVPMQAIGPDYSRAVVAGSDDIHVVDLASGNVSWKHSVKYESYATPYLLSDDHVAVFGPVTSSCQMQLQVFLLKNGTVVRNKTFSAESGSWVAGTQMKGKFAKFAVVGGADGTYTFNSTLYDFVEDKVVFQLKNAPVGISTFEVIKDNAVVMGVSNFPQTWTNVYPQSQLTGGYLLGVDLNNHTAIFNHSYPKTLVMGEEMETHNGRLFATLSENRNFSTYVAPMHFVQLDATDGKPVFDVQLPTSKGQRSVFDDFGNMIIPNLMGATVINATTGMPKQYSLDIPGVVPSSFAALDDGRLVFAQLNKVVCVEHDV